jgi:hypothetical protein
MCPWKHIEMLVMWKSSKKAAILILKAAVQLTAVPIKITARRNDIFTYYCRILFNSIFFSVSTSIIWFLSFSLTKTITSFCSYYHIPHSLLKSHSAIDKSHFKPTREKEKLHGNNNNNSNDNSNNNG